MSQPSQPEIKIRTLPRSDAKAKPKAETSPPRWIIYVGTTSALLLALAFVIPAAKPGRSSKGNRPVARVAPSASHQADFSSLDKVDTTSVTRHIQESLMKARVLRTQQALDNWDVRIPSAEFNGLTADEDSGRSYGVQLDSEDTPDRLFRELNNRDSGGSNDNLPNDRINARLANRRWVGQAEREERIAFVRSFIRSAYDRGYEVEIDQNLVVVGVKPVTQDKKVDIDKVIEKMAQQGL